MQKMLTKVISLLGKFYITTPSPQLRAWKLCPAGQLYPGKTALPPHKIVGVGCVSPSPVVRRARRIWAQAAIYSKAQRASTTHAAHYTCRAARASSSSLILGVLLSTNIDWVSDNRQLSDGADFHLIGVNRSLNRQSRPDYGPPIIPAAVTFFVGILTDRRTSLFRASVWY